MTNGGEFVQEYSPARPKSCVWSVSDRVERCRGKQSRHVFAFDLAICSHSRDAVDCLSDTYDTSKMKDTLLTTSCPNVVDCELYLSTDCTKPRAESPSSPCLCFIDYRIRLGINDMRHIMSLDMSVDKTC
jgi:hypothetical protein